VQFGPGHFSQPLLFADPPRLAPAPRLKSAGSSKYKSLAEELAAFKEFGKPTRVLATLLPLPNGTNQTVPAFVNEFWTARQCQGHSLHEISYRACFKPQLPRFFIERLTQAGQTVYDPFMGRGTTLIEAALLGRVPLGCDVNPLSAMLTAARLRPPSLEEIAHRLSRIHFKSSSIDPEDGLLVFFHPETLRQILSLKKYLLARQREGSFDRIDDWIRLVALNRLTGHSPGFFSVYTMPPNQAVSIRSQRKINEKRNQTPPPRDVAVLILRKSRNLLTDCSESTRSTLREMAPKAMLLSQSSDQTPLIANNSVALVVTSPPFLNIVDYATDNWLRCWFVGLNEKEVKLTVPRKLGEWQSAMFEVLRELHRVLKPGGHVAFEVGEVHAGKTKLEEAVLPAGVTAGLEPLLILINDQKFTKTANCWGVDNNSRGTNTNRIIVFRKA
jgi:hypothetical protein